MLSVEVHSTFRDHIVYHYGLKTHPLGLSWVQRVALTMWVCDA